MKRDIETALQLDGREGSENWGQLTTRRLKRQNRHKRSMLAEWYHENIDETCDKSTKCPIQSCTVCKSCGTVSSEEQKWDPDPGTLVWVQTRPCYPWWPGLVYNTRFCDADVCERGKFTVLCYGTNDYELAVRSQMAPFDLSDMRYTKQTVPKKYKHKFEKALTAAAVDVKLTARDLMHRMYLKHVLRECVSGDPTTSIRPYQAIFNQMKDCKYRDTPIRQKALEQVASESSELDVEVHSVGEKREEYLHENFNDNVGVFEEDGVEEKLNHHRNEKMDLLNFKEEVHNLERELSISEQ